jgi:hypothetical protein
MNLILRDSKMRDTVQAERSITEDVQMTLNESISVHITNARSSMVQKDH